MQSCIIIIISARFRRQTFFNEKSSWAQVERCPSLNAISYHLGNSMLAKCNCQPGLARTLRCFQVEKLTERRVAITNLDRPKLTLCSVSHSGHEGKAKGTLEYRYHNYSHSLLGNSMIIKRPNGTFCKRFCIIYMGHIITPNQPAFKVCVCFDVL